MTLRSLFPQHNLIGRRHACRLFAFLESKRAIAILRHSSIRKMDSADLQKYHRCRGLGNHHGSDPLLTVHFALGLGEVYLKLPSHSDWRSRASLVGLSSPVLSAGLWVVALAVARAKDWHTTVPAMQHFIVVGILIPIAGMLVGLFGRPRLILSIVPASLGAVLFWFGTTLP
jgi:hypothetical protein